MMGLTGSVTGVDVSAERLAACRTLCEKYGIRNARLVHQDGRNFCLPPPRRRDELVPGVGESSGGSNVIEHRCVGRGQGELDPSETPLLPVRKVRRRYGPGEDRGVTFVGSDLRPDDVMREVGTAIDGAFLASGPPTTSVARSGSPPLSAAAQGPSCSLPDCDWAMYDRVLVDAECTHDGSVKHLAKFAQWGWGTFEARFLQPERLSTIAALQLELLRSGFRSLRSGGTLVYSTCSFTRAQNEVVVAALLDAEPRSSLCQIDELACAPCCAGGLEYTLRFEPRTARTSGLFIARIVKREF